MCIPTSIWRLRAPPVRRTCPSSHETRYIFTLLALTWFVYHRLQLWNLLRLRGTMNIYILLKELVPSLGFPICTGWNKSFIKTDLFGQELWAMWMIREVSEQGSLLSEAKMSCIVLSTGIIYFFSNIDINLSNIVIYQYHYRWWLSLMVNL